MKWEDLTRQGWRMRADRRKAGKRRYVILVDKRGIWWDRYEKGLCVQGYQPREEN